MQSTKVTAQGTLIAVTRKEYNETPIAEYIVQFDGKFGPESLKFEKYGDEPQASEGDEVKIEGYVKGNLYTNKKTGAQDVFTKIALSQIEVTKSAGNAAPIIEDDNDELPF